jgi:DNA mismatch repair protein MutS
VDRLFARIGASDELHSGQSTFMVEMTETANMLNNATDRSLVILDEIGRGTSTLDGLSLAWAIAEHIASELRCRTLFATHYHELTELEQLLPGVQNVHVAVQEAGNEIIFLRRVAPGSADKSYGIEVARLAGLPHAVIARAREILRVHEKGEEQLTTELSPGATAATNSEGGVVTAQGALHQSSFTAIDESVLKAIRSADLDKLTPIETMNLLAELQKQLS